jgi:hypothetical protein
MRPSVRFLAAGAAVLAAAVTIQGSAAGAASPHSDADEGGREATTMTFDVKFSPFNYIDLAKPGRSAADEIVFHDKLFQNGRQVGDDLGSCIVVDANGLANCTGVVRLAPGTVTFAFANEPPPKKVFAITGGTGKYRTARGDGSVVEFATGPTGTLTLRIIRGE